MQLDSIEQNGIKMVISSENVITDIQSAIDLLATLNYETGAKRSVIKKENVVDSFFVLSVGLAGEVKKKLLTIRQKLQYTAFKPGIQANL